MYKAWGVHITVMYVIKPSLGEHFGYNRQHHALIIIPLFITQAPTCFGTYVPSSGSVLHPCELLSSNYVPKHVGALVIKNEMIISA
jgi:hypothetical protein